MSDYTEFTRYIDETASHNDVVVPEDSATAPASSSASRGPDNKGPASDSTATAATITTRVASTKGCDESRCVSKGLNYLSGFSFTCYGDELALPRMCADGYIPHLVEDEPTRSHVNWDAQTEVSYFTCCPPEESSSTLSSSSMSSKSLEDAAATKTLPSATSAAATTTTATTTTTDPETITRHCSDPIPFGFDVDASEEDYGLTLSGDLCANQEDLDPSYRYPRRMEASIMVPTRGYFGIFPSRTDSVVCCDAPLPVDEINETESMATTTTTTTEHHQHQHKPSNFLDEIDCVPYRNELYDHRLARNSAGLLVAISCDFPDGSFVVPRPLEGFDETDVRQTGRFRCCRSDSTSDALDPFVKDANFRTSVQLPLVLWSLAVAVSLLTVVALLIPLLVQIRERTSGSSRFISTRSTGQCRSKRGSSSPRIGYSTYNLYVVYLALIDLVFALFQIGFYWSILNQRFNPGFNHVVTHNSWLIYVICIFHAEDGPLTYTMINTNMWINAVISYELLLLLQQSRRARKINQPSIRRVHAQVGSVLLLMGGYCATCYGLRHLSIKAGLEGDFARVQFITNVIHSIYWIFLVTPIAFFLGITVLICTKGYVPSRGQTSCRDRALRHLFFFFLRIMMVFVLVWIPATTLVYLGTWRYQPVYFLWAWCLLGVQPVLSTLMILTKCDVRRYVWDLVSLAYCRNGGVASSGDNKDKSHKGSSTKTFRTKTFRTSVFRSQESCKDDVHHHGSSTADSSIDDSFIGKRSTPFTSAESTSDRDVSDHSSSYSEKATGGSEDEEEEEEHIEHFDEDDDCSESLQFSIFGRVDEPSATRVSYTSSSSDFAKDGDVETAPNSATDISCLDAIAEEEPVGGAATSKDDADGSVTN